MEEQKLKIAREWLRSVVQQGAPDSTNFGLKSVGDMQYLLTFERPEKQGAYHLTSEQLEAIADNNEAVRTEFYNNLVELVRT